MNNIWGYRVAALLAAGLLAAVALLPAQRALAAEWQTYLAETFDQPETMFYSGQAGEAFYSVEEGRYLVDGLNTDSDSLSALTDGMYYYYAEASCEMLESTAGDLAFSGLVFHYNKKTQGKLSYYVFYVYGDGYYGAKRVIGDQVEIVLPLTRTTELVANRPNTLGLDAQGTRFDLYINGKYVDGFTDVRIDGGGFGFYISKHSKAAFDDFVVKVEQRGGMQPVAEPNAVESGVAPEEGPNSASGESEPQYRFPDIPKNPNRPVYPWEVGVDKSRKGKAKRKAEQQEQEQEQDEQPSAGAEDAADSEATPEQEPQEPPQARSDGVPSEHGKLAPGEGDTKEAEGQIVAGGKQDAGSGEKKRPKKDQLKKPKATPPKEEPAAPPADDESYGSGSSGNDQDTETESPPSDVATDVALIPAPPAQPVPATPPTNDQAGELLLPQGEELIIGQAPVEETAVRPPLPAPKASAAASEPEPVVEPEAEAGLASAEPEPQALPDEPATLELEQPEPPAAEPDPAAPPELQPEAVPGLITWPTAQQPAAPDAPGGTAAQASRNNALRGMRSSGDDWADPNADTEVVAEHKPARRPLPADKQPAASQPADEAATEPAEPAELALTPEVEQPAASPAEALPAEPESALPLFPEQEPIDSGPGGIAPAEEALPVGERQGDKLTFEQPPTEAPELPAAGNPPEKLSPEPAEVDGATGGAAPVEPQASALTAPADELTVIQDDFTQPRWPVAESPASVYRYFGAAYEINNLKAETMAISFQEGALADLELGLDAEYLDGQSYVGYGVAGRFTVTDGSVSYYGLFVSQSGEFLLLKVLNGTEYVLQDWTASSLLSPSKPSRLKLELIGTAIRAYINNELVATLQDGDLTSGGYALLVGPGCSARFDNLLLRGITQAAKQALSASGL